MAPRSSCTPARASSTATPMTHTAWSRTGRSGRLRATSRQLSRSSCRRRPTRARSRSTRRMAVTERLYRSSDDRMLAGVAGGVAEMLDADPSIIRIVWALLVVLTGGLALLVYIVMAVVVPEAPPGHAQAAQAAAGVPTADGDPSATGDADP